MCVQPPAPRAPTSCACGLCVGATATGRPPLWHGGARHGRGGCLRSGTWGSQQRPRPLQLYLLFCAPCAGAQLARKHGISANDLVNKWSAHCVNSNTPDNALNNQRLDDFEKQLKKSSKRSSNQFESMQADTESFDQSNIGGLCVHADTPQAPAAVKCRPPRVRARARRASGTAPLVVAGVCVCVRAYARVRVRVCPCPRRGLACSLYWRTPRMSARFCAFLQV